MSFPSSLSHSYTPHSVLLPQGVSYPLSLSAQFRIAENADEQVYQKSLNHSDSYYVRCLPFHLAVTIRNRVTMAIHPTLRRSQATSGNTLSPQQAMAISTWTEQATASLQNLNVSQSPPARDENASAAGPASTRQTFRGTSVSLEIPLDDDVRAVEHKPTPQDKENQKVSVSFRRRAPVQRSGWNKRDALLKGKDGSRRRQRWENGMF